ncbi:hypothetical protein QWZ08_12420 [Ferruginibacter paludis]|uniref:hypothetical protein n=1 Tax=Ferruginibacter TaxID=1004303 RepID=UPI0025B4D0CD|nr:MULTISPECIES: hypothetical protein [Ferruginibacter]MDB5277215.1 hypothetical protein [Ferruginibacter sp.]MDN3656440.1 hypothetical protein [Ferruginibacter paludis]
MKFQSGQTVTVLDTEYKPAGSAVVCNYQENSNKYEVDFIYPGHDKADKISVPEERLILPGDILHR